jgi:hypothetical protein
VTLVVVDRGEGGMLRPRARYRKLYGQQGEGNRHNGVGEEGQALRRFATVLGFIHWLHARSLRHGLLHIGDRLGREPTEQGRIVPTGQGQAEDQREGELRPRTETAGTAPRPFPGRQVSRHYSQGMIRVVPGEVGTAE